MSRRAVSGLTLALVCLAFAETARADELADFERARQSYDAQSYVQAVQQFEALVGGESPRLTTRALVLESRKYLGAAYLFTHDEGRAEEQFARLLREDPTYPDPASFPAEVRQVFSRVRTRVERERHDAEEAARLAALRRQHDEAARIERDRHQLTRLRELAAEETVVQENSRVIAALPFGIGQFQNGHTAVGITLLSLESVFALAGTITAIWHAELAPPPSDGAPHPDVQFAEDALVIANWVSLGALVLTAVLGVIDAEARFVPETRTTRARPLPPDLRPAAGLRVTPLPLGVRVDF